MAEMGVVPPKQAAGAAKGALPPMRKFEGPSAFAVLKRLQDALTK